MSFDRHKGRHKKQKKKKKKHVQINRIYKQTETRNRPKGWSRPRQKQKRFGNVKANKQKETWNRPTVFKQIEAPNRDKNRTDSQTYVVAAQVSVIQSGSLSS